MNNVKMFTIDLLKGQGIPARSRPENVAVMAVTLAVPAIIAIIMLGYYMHSSIVTSVQKKEIASYETMTNKLSESAALQKAFKTEKETVKGCLSEVATTINKYTQWTPILVEMVKSMPDSILLTGVNVTEETVQKKILLKGNPGQMTDSVVPIKTLQINVSENPGLDYGRSIRDFEDRLRSSPVFGPRLDNINVSQDVETFKGQGVVLYQINCVFKPTS